MRRAIEDHAVPSWRVHEHAAEFELLDVWRFPIRIAPEVPLATFLEFRTQVMADFTKGSSLTGKLFALRSWIGQILGWDGEPRAGEESVPFEPVYRLEEEELLEIENATVHALMHICRVVLDDGGDWAPQMGVYVKRKGILGRAYMAAIAPFRYWIVYPALMRAVEREWPAYRAGHS